MSWHVILKIFICSLVCIVVGSLQSLDQLQNPNNGKSSKPNVHRDTQWSIRGGGAFSQKSDYFAFAEKTYGVEGGTSSIAVGMDLYDGEDSLQLGVGASWFMVYSAKMTVGSKLPLPVTGSLSAKYWALPVILQARYFFLGNLYLGAGAGFSLTQLDFHVSGTGNVQYDTNRSESRLVPVVQFKLGDEFSITNTIFLGVQAELFYTFAKHDVGGVEQSLNSFHFLPSLCVGYYF